MGWYRRVVFICSSVPFIHRHCAFVEAFTRQVSAKSTFTREVLPLSAAVIFMSPCTLGGGAPDLCGISFVSSRQC
jgi:hypothetical protein